MPPCQPCPGHAHLMSKNAHPCSRNHRFPHLVSKTAPARSRTPAISLGRQWYFAISEVFLTFASTSRQPLEGSRLRPRRRGEIPCQPRRQLRGRLARSRFFYKRRLPTSTERPEVPLNEAKKRKLLSFFLNYLYLYAGRRIDPFFNDWFLKLIYCQP